MIVYLLYTLSQTFPPVTPPTIGTLFAQLIPQPWLTSEQDNVAVFDDFDIPRQVLPRRYTTGDKAVWVRYFALELPISIGPETITFVHVAPGYDTDRNLVAWGSSHAPLWRALRRMGRRIRVVAVARDDLRLGRANNIRENGASASARTGLSPSRSSHRSVWSGRF